jgi:TrmH family RNA methyltransferase
MGFRSDVPLPSDPYRLTVVLVGATHPGNLGAVCRGMLNHGFAQLRLVRPRCSPEDEEARNRAKHAGVILDGCTIHESLDEAVADATLVVGTSGKRELGRKTLFRHFLHPWELAERAEEGDSHIALVFGEEGTGLDQTDLERCDVLATLPTWEGYPIANLSHAVTLFLYEFHRRRVHERQGKDLALPEVTPLERRTDPTLRGVVREAVSDFAEALPGQPERRESVKHTLTRITARSGASDDELTRIVGAMVDATTALQHASGDPAWLKDRRRRVER